MLFVIARNLPAMREHWRIRKGDLRTCVTFKYWIHFASVPFFQGHCRWLLSCNLLPSKDLISAKIWQTGQMDEPQSVGSVSS